MLGVFKTGNGMPWWVPVAHRSGAFAPKSSSLASTADLSDSASEREHPPQRIASSLKQSHGAQRTYHITPREYSLGPPPQLPDTLSFIHVFSHERENHALHRIQARSEDWKVLMQNVRILTAPNDSGIGVVAVAGESETVFQQEGGRTLVATDQLHSRSMRQVGSRWFLRMDKNIGPVLQTFDGMGSAQVTQSALRDLLRMTPNGQDQGFFFRNKPSDFMAARERLLNLGHTFGALSASLTSSLRENVLLGLSTRTSEKGVRASASATSTVGDTLFRIQSSAQKHRIAGDDLGDPAEPLGLVGSITIGGTRVSVTSSDTLYSLAAALNQTEDGNANSLLDEGEDRNGNGLLDLGSPDSGVSAWVENGRLLLESVTPGSVSFSVESEGGVAQALGLLERVADNAFQHKHILQKGTDAVLTQDGQTFVGTGNRFTDLPNGLDLELVAHTLSFEPSESKPLEFTVQVEDASNKAVAAIGSFVDSYNKAMTDFNRSVMYPGVLDSDVILFSLRADMLSALSAEHPADASDENSIRRLSDVGIQMRDSRRLRIPQLSLVQMRNSKAAGVERVLPESIDSVPSFLKSLNQIGIVDRTNGTLEVNETMFREAISERRQEVYSLLASEERGVLTAFNRLADEASSTSYGRVSNQIQYYTHMASRYEGITVERQRYFQFKAEQMSPQKALGELLDIST